MPLGFNDPIGTEPIGVIPGSGGTALARGTAGYSGSLPLVGRSTWISSGRGRLSVLTGLAARVTSISTGRSVLSPVAKLAARITGQGKGQAGFSGNLSVFGRTAANTNDRAAPVYGAVLSFRTQSQAKAQSGYSG